MEAHRDDADWFAAAELVDLAPVPLFRTTLVGTITEANVAASELTGVERRFLVRKPLALFSTDRRALRGLVARATALPPGETISHEAVLEGRGGLRAVQLFVRRSADSLVWAIHDVRGSSSLETELRLLTEELEARVEERTVELEAERARLDAVVAGMPAGVIVAEAQSGRIVLTNGQAELLMRRSLLEGDAIASFGEQTALDEYGRPLAAQDWPLARALLAGESVRNVRIRFERDDSTWLSIEANASPIRDQARDVVAAVVVFWDVSERDRRERAEREFITNAAHELQTPLAAIVSAIEVLITGAKDVPEDRDRFLGHVEREAARLVRVVRSLLLLARAQMAHESLVTVSVHLRPLLDGIALGLRPRKGIEVVVRCPARLTLTTSPDLLEQAVGNLAANSVRHTLDGRIVLSAKRVDQEIVIEVADTGTGIASEDAERLFGRFVRGSARDPEGFGLGLAIVRESVAALGGSVGIIGAARRWHRDAHRPAGIGQGRRMNSRVLVVDDEPALRDSVTYALEREGFEVSSVEDGETALELVRRESFDAVVLDLMLPGVPGTEVCRRHAPREQHPDRDAHGEGRRGRPRRRARARGRRLRDEALLARRAGCARPRDPAAARARPR